MSDVRKKFDAAAAAVLKAKKDPGSDMKLKLYAHYKQATEGDVQGEKPGFTDFVNRAKYDAWDDPFAPKAAASHASKPAMLEVK